MRDILHCDLNSFFASVECLKNPKLKTVPMAVCGDPKLRHGIILAKNDIAKKYGIYTPETVYSALKKCPNLILVKSNHSDYERFSKLVNNIYLKYTDRVEPFGIDESFLDITESKKLFGTPVEIAYKIKEEVKATLGLTISVGISFNKSLAKLGSDLKKPDACTYIPYDSFRKIIYPISVNNLLFVGKSTSKILNKMRINTIGELAVADKEKLMKNLGKSGLMLYNFANGKENEEVKKWEEFELPKSFSKGYTFPKDIVEKNILENMIRKMTYEIVRNMRKYNLKCSVVGISIKNFKFITITRQKHINVTNIYSDIINNMLELLDKNYVEGEKIRAITVFLNNLTNELENKQLSIFDIIDNDTDFKIENIARVVDKLEEDYGREKIKFGCIYNKNEYIESLL